ncbi:MAG: ABC transporter permease, partial [Calditrichaeota bacterium]|nr:ABC transporter permease [Calditrichota bacterium]
ALQSLKSNPLRSVLTLVGIAVGIAAVLYVVTLGEITQRRINEQLESMGSNVLMIRPGYSRMRGVRTGANVVNLTLADAREIEQASQVITSVTPTYSGQSAAEYKDQNWSTRITGTTPEYTRVNNEKIIEGRFFTAEEMERRARVCV